MKSYYDRNAMEPRYDLGDKVWVGVYFENAPLEPGYSTGQGRKKVCSFKYVEAPSPTRFGCISI